MTRLARLQPIENDATRGPEVGLGEAVGAGFDLAKPEAGFFAGHRLASEVNQDAWAAVESTFYGPGEKPELSDDERRELSFMQQEDFDEDQVRRLSSIMAEQGFEVPEALRPDVYTARRDQVLGDMQELRARERETLSRASKGTELFGTLAGGAWAELSDPVNFATLAIGASARAGLLATMATEAGINAAIEGVQTPSRNTFRRMIDEPETSMITNMAFGAVFGGAFGGVMKGAQLGAPRLGEMTSDGMNRLGMMMGREDRRALADVAARSGDRELADVAAAVRRDIEDEAAVLPRPTREGVREHEARLQAATEAAQRGELPAIPDRPIAANRETILTPERLSEQFNGIMDRVVRDIETRADIDAPTVQRLDPETAGPMRAQVAEVRRQFDEFIRTQADELVPPPERARIVDAAVRNMRQDPAIRAAVEARVTQDNPSSAPASRALRERVDSIVEQVAAAAQREGPVLDAVIRAQENYQRSGRLKDAARGLTDAITAQVRRGDFDQPPSRASEAPRQEEPRADPNEGFGDPVTGDGARVQIEATRDALNDTQPSPDGLDAIPVGSRLNDDGEVVPVTMSRQEIRDELDADDEFLEAIKICGVG